MGRCWRRLIYYGAGRQRLIAVVEVVADEPRARPGVERWPWELDVRPLLAIPADENAPSPGDVGISPLRLRRQSHIRLDRAEYRRIVLAILEAGAASAGVSPPE